MWESWRVGLQRLGVRTELGGGYRVSIQREKQVPCSEVWMSSAERTLVAGLRTEWRIFTDTLGKWLRVRS